MDLHTPTAGLGAGRDDHPPAAAAPRIIRGVRRLLADHGFATLTEVALASGRRADILAYDGRQDFVIVEVKSGVPDFRSDRKWPDYRDFCDRLYFAVDDLFPQELIPEPCGLIVADAFQAAILREPADHRLAPARRSALLRRFAVLAAQRLHRLEDPALVPPA